MVVRMRCPVCSAPALADDEFCESCGQPLGQREDAARRHVEVFDGPAAGVSDRGLRHARNEDAVFVAADGTVAVAVVCDGVSVSAAPQVASQVAAETAGRRLVQVVGAGSGPAEMAEALGAGGDAVAGVPWLAMSDRNGPSSTVVAVAWNGTVLTVGWAGDSRAYWVDDEGAQLLTVDHSWAQEQVAAGALPADLAEHDPRAHVITRWLGEDAPRPADTTTLVPPGAGRVVLCTDGLWNVLADGDDLAGLVAIGGDPLAVAERLVATALDRGGPDNVTVAVVDIDPGGR
jgi:serine/threonine protein phosphatase PrpC